MKVICIHGVKIGDIATQNSSGATRPAVSEDLIFEGEVYTVFHAFSDQYILQERCPFISYHKSRFLPISEISETEMERNYSLNKTVLI